MKFHAYRTGETPGIVFNVASERFAKRKATEELANSLNDGQIIRLVRLTDDNEPTGEVWVRQYDTGRWFALHLEVNDGNP